MPAVKHRHWLVAALRGLARPGQPLRAAEIGVASGLLSEHLLRELPDLRLTMVDRWRAARLGEPDVPATTRKTQATYDAALAEATRRTDFAATRRQIVRADSVQAAAEFSRHDWFLLVFIDAGHHYGSVRADIRAWWPTVRPGGWLAGHDIDSPKDRAGTWGVRRAVVEFAIEHLLPFCVDEDSHCWWMEKP